MGDLVAARERGGPFTSLDDFAGRIDPRQLNKRQLESLAGAGAFDCITPDRASVHASAETIMGHASAAADQRESGQHALFGDGGAGLAPIRLAAVSPWRSEEHTSEVQSLMRTSSAVFCLKKKTQINTTTASLYLQN